MEIKRVVTGYLDENCYLLIKNGNCLVVDPGDEYNKIKDEIGDNKGTAAIKGYSCREHPEVTHTNCGTNTRQNKTKSGGK